MQDRIRQGISQFGNNVTIELGRIRDTYKGMRAVIVRSVPAHPSLDNLFSEFVGGAAFAFDPQEEQ